MLFAPGWHSARAKTAMACPVWLCYLPAIRRFCRLGSIAQHVESGAPPSCLFRVTTAGLPCACRVAHASTVRRHHQGKEGVYACREAP